VGLIRNGERSNAPDYTLEARALVEELVCREWKVHSSSDAGMHAHLNRPPGAC
jgi:hypothetical protein